MHVSKRCEVVMLVSSESRLMIWLLSKIAFVYEKIKLKQKKFLFPLYILIFIEKLDEDPRFSSSQFKSFVKGLEMTDDQKWTSDFVNQSGSNLAQGTTTIICECHKGRYLYFIMCLRRARGYSGSSITAIFRPKYIAALFKITAGPWLSGPWLPWSLQYRID